MLPFVDEYIRWKSNQINILRRSTKQIPNYLENQKALRKEGIKKVIVYCVVSLFCDKSNLWSSVLLHSIFCFCLVTPPSTIEWRCRNGGLGEGPKNRFIPVATHGRSEGTNQFPCCKTASLSHESNIFNSHKPFVLQNMQLAFKPWYITHRCW